ncbi:hypothetical protein EMCRGX_G003221 [Ephydatia muelleri]
MPGRSKVTEVIDETHAIMLVKLKALLQQSFSVSLTTDAAKMPTGDYYVAVTCHWISMDWCLMSAVLGLFIKNYIDPAKPKNAPVPTNSTSDLVSTFRKLVNKIHASPLMTENLRAAQIDGPAAELITDGGVAVGAVLTAAVLPQSKHRRFEDCDFLDADEELDLNSASAAQANESNDLRREVKDEFDAWLSVPETRLVNTTSPIDPLAKWKLLDSRFPRISKLARNYFAIPASSAPSERVFSRAKLIQQRQRWNLLSDWKRA